MWAPPRRSFHESLQRAPQRRIFAAQDGAFEGRVAAAAETFAGHPMVAELVEFIRTQSHRPLCQPAGDEP